MKRINNIGKDFIQDKRSCLILGDNLFFGHNLPEILDRSVLMEKGGVVFGYWVKDLQRYGVADFIIQEESAKGLPGVVNLLGIESPGLTAPLAIANYVEGILP